MKIVGRRGTSRTPERDLDLIGRFIDPHHCGSRRHYEFIFILGMTGNPIGQH